MFDEILHLALLPDFFQGQAETLMRLFGSFAAFKAIDPVSARQHRIGLRSIASGLAGAKRSPAGAGTTRLSGSRWTAPGIRWIERSKQRVTSGNEW
jgi:hypothetical protein